MYEEVVSIYMIDDVLKLKVHYKQLDPQAVYLAQVMGEVERDSAPVYSSVESRQEIADLVKYCLTGATPRKRSRRITLGSLMEFAKINSIHVLQLVCVPVLILSVGSTYKERYLVNLSDLVGPSI